MKKETKSEVILEFIKDLKELIQKIENNEGIEKLLELNYK